MNAYDIQIALAAKHAGDVYVAECKNGPSAGSSHSRLDGWAMAKSWSKPHVYGYEIKVSRSDFQRDEKWQNYLALCNSLYFVCPPKLIQPEELPGDVGLLWCHGTRLLSKKKAAYRAVQIPESLWRYVVMCRSKIVDSTFNSTEGESVREYWERWLKQKEEDRDIGHQASRGLAQLYAKRVKLVQKENERLKEENTLLATTKALVEKLGISKWDSEASIKSKFERLKEIVPPHVILSIENGADQLERIAQALKEASA